MKRSQAAVIVFSLPCVLALRERPWGDNLGGIGTPKDKIAYEIIDEQTIDSVDGYKLSLQLYYKTRDFRELHGNLTLQTKGLANFSNVRFGWLWTEDQVSGHYDGLHVETRFVRSLVDQDSEQENFSGYDVWTDTRPDTIDHGVNVLELPIDRVQDFNINPVKCWKKCDADGICSFNAHFWRFFETKDGKDNQLDENVDKLAYLLGYFEIESILTGAVVSQGLSDDIKIKIGRIRDYELSGD